MSHAGPRTWLGAVVRTPVRAYGKLTSGQVNARPPVRVFPQAPPDPIQQGVATPARPAVVQVFTSYHDTNAPMEGRFVARIYGPNPRAAYPRGRQSPFSPRANIKVPPHVAYGSLFESSSPPYGLG